MQAILDKEALWLTSPIDGTRNDTHHENMPEHMEMFYGDGSEAGGDDMDYSYNSKDLHM